MFEKNSDLQHVISMLRGHLAAQAAMLDALIDSSPNKAALRQCFMEHLDAERRTTLMFEVATEADSHYRTGLDAYESRALHRLDQS